MVFSEAWGMRKYTPQHAQHVGGPGDISGPCTCTTLLFRTRSKPQVAYTPLDQ
jgi:hypothetical protein